MLVIGREAGREHVAVDGDAMGGTDGGEGCSSTGSEYTVSKNGRRESGGGDWKTVVLGKCRVFFVLIFRI